MTTSNKTKKAYVKSNVWGNYYVLVSGKKVYDIYGKKSNKPELFEWIKSKYPEIEIIDQTKY